MAEPPTSTVGEAVGPVGPDDPVPVPDTAPARPGPWQRLRARGQLPVVAAVAVGGAIGSCARYGAALAWPAPDGGFPWATFTVNVTGCAVIGVFMVIITDVWAAHRLVRPFFGTGVLGGFTTFSTYVTDVRRLADGGHPRTALAYLVLTVAAALTAVWAASALARRTVQWRQKCD
jgi:CrcB protein